MEKNDIVDALSKDIFAVIAKYTSNKCFPYRVRIEGNCEDKCFDISICRDYKNVVLSISSLKHEGTHTLIFNQEKE